MMRRCVFWCYSAPLNGGATLTQLASSIRAAHSHASTLPLMLATDGNISCRSIAPLVHGLPCVEFQVNSADHAVVQPGTLHLMVGAVPSRREAQLLGEIASVLGAQALAKREDHRATFANPAFSGVLMRYWVPRVLLKVGFEQALYLDADTCVQGGLEPMFDASHDTPLTVASRGTTHMARMELAPLPSASAWKTVLRQWGFRSLRHYEQRAFNNGVMVLNLAPFSKLDLLQKMSGIASSHMGGQRILTGQSSDQTLMVLAVAANLTHMVDGRWNCRPSDAYYHRESYCLIRHRKTVHLTCPSRQGIAAS